MTLEIKENIKTKGYYLNVIIGGFVGAIVVTLIVWFSLGLGGDGQDGMILLLTFPFGWFIGSVIVGLSFQERKPLALSLIAIFGGVLFFDIIALYFHSFSSFSSYRFVSSC